VTTGSSGGGRLLTATTLGGSAKRSERQRGKKLRALHCACARGPRVSPQYPLSPDRRLHMTDAGFIDNLGVDSLVRIFSDPKVVAWVRNNNADVTILQVRSFPSDSGAARRQRGTTAVDDCEWQELALPETARRTYFYLTSTIQSLLNAHTAGNIVRASEELKLVSYLYDNGRFRTFTFENSARVSLSWYITARELRCLANEMATVENSNELESLAKFMASQ
jgi:hypothetical protein